MKSKRAWTLIELLVALMLFSAVAGFIISFFVSGQKRSRSLDFRLHALQAAYLLRARFADDLASSMPAPAGAEAINEASALELLRVRAQRGGGLGGTSIDEDLSVITEQVAYRFDPNTHRVYRNGEAMTSERFLDVTFSYFPYTDEDRGEVVELHATIVPDEHLDDPGRREYPRHEVVSFTFHLTQSTIVHAYPELLTFHH